MVEWAIKGYHHFRIRPHKDIPLMVLKERGNRFDPFAMKLNVVMPTLGNIPGHLWDATTHPGEGYQLVRHIAGHQVGRVPANLCQLFWQLLDRGLTQSITWYLLHHLICNNNTISIYIITRTLLKRCWC